MIMDEKRVGIVMEQIRIVQEWFSEMVEGEYKATGSDAGELLIKLGVQE